MNAAQVSHGKLGGKLLAVNLVGLSSLVNSPLYTSKTDNKVHDSLHLKAAVQYEPSVAPLNQCRRDFENSKESALVVQR